MLYLVTGHISLSPAAGAAAPCIHTSIIQIRQACLLPPRWQRVRQTPILMMGAHTGLLHLIIHASIFAFSVLKILCSPLPLLSLALSLPVAVHFTPNYLLSSIPASSTSFFSRFSSFPTWKWIKPTHAPSLELGHVDKTGHKAESWHFYQHIVKIRLTRTKKNICYWLNIGQSVTITKSIL